MGRTLLLSLWLPLAVVAQALVRFGFSVIPAPPMPGPTMAAAIVPLFVFTWPAGIPLTAAVRRLHARSPRAACAVGQVAAADSLDLAQTSWKDTGIDIEEYARAQAIRRARGEIAPLPQGTDKAPNLNGWAHLDKVIGYRPVEDASRITIPLLVVDAEHEELFDRHRAGELSVERAKANGARAEYRVSPDITHYDIYREAFDESAEMAREWFNGCLKD